MDHPHTRAPDDPQQAQARTLFWALSESERALGVENPSDLPLSFRIQTVLRLAGARPHIIPPESFRLLYLLGAASVTDAASAANAQ
jgi:hypothetical protein